MFEDETNRFGWLSNPQGLSDDESDEGDDTEGGEEDQPSGEEDGEGQLDSEHGDDGGEGDEGGEVDGVDHTQKPSKSGGARKVKIGGAEYDFEGDDLEELEIVQKVDGKDVKVKVRDALRADRTYQAADRRMREVTEEVAQKYAELEAYVSDPRALLKAAGHDVDAMIATLAAQDLSKAELARLRALPTKTVEQYKEIEELEYQLSELAKLERDRRAKVDTASKGARERAAAQEAHRTTLVKALPGSLKSEGLDPEDALVQAVALSVYEDKPRADADELAARTREAIHGYVAKSLAGLKGEALLKALPKELIKEIRKADSKQADAAAKRKGAEAAGRASSNRAPKAKGPGKKGGVPSDQVLRMLRY